MNWRAGNETQRESEKERMQETRTTEYNYFVPKTKITKKENQRTLFFSNEQKRNKKITLKEKKTRKKEHKILQLEDEREKKEILMLFSSFSRK